MKGSPSWKPQLGGLLVRENQWRIRSNVIIAGNSLFHGSIWGSVRDWDLFALGRTPLWGENLLSSKSFLFWSVPSVPGSTNPPQALGGIPQNHTPLGSPSQTWSNLLPCLHSHHKIAVLLAFFAQVRAFICWWLSASAYSRRALKPYEPP